MSDPSAAPPESVDTIWSALKSAASGFGHPFRMPALATVDPATAAPRLRTVILRQVRPESGSLVGFTDHRSPKTAHLAANPTVEWLFHDPAEGVQIRASGAAAVHTGDETAALAWADVPSANRANYCSLNPPGTRLADGACARPTDWPADSPSREQLEAGFQNFAMIITRVDRFDWLFLTSPVNQRVCFERAENGNAWRRFGLVP